jgi:Domain of unknown function (DUF3883)
MSAGDFAQAARISVFEAILALQHIRANSRDASTNEAVSVLASLSSRHANLDYSSALKYERYFQVSADDPYEKCLRSYLCELSSVLRPTWLSLTSHGRDAVRKSMSATERQCFTCAGFFADNPEPDVLKWWDARAAEARGERDLDCTGVGREAEALSLKYEIERLRALGIARKPIWVALENQSAGYDLLSYDLEENNAVPRLIEVKGSNASPQRFFVTRHEWNTALESVSPYVFHIWNLAARTLLELSIADIASHMPIDQGRGSWTRAEVTWQAGR